VNKQSNNNSQNPKQPHNKFNCAPLIWKKFTDTGRKVYNATYEAIRDQSVINCHPLAKELSRTPWLTVAHNSACMAAWAAELNEKGEL